MVSKADKKTITLVLIFKIILISLVVLLVVPVFQVEEDMIIQQRSGIDLISQHFDQTELFEEPVACIQQFDPVCTVGGVTFPNQCEADVAGETVLFKGVCP